MKWNKFRLTTTTEAEDIVSSMLMDLGLVPSMPAGADVSCSKCWNGDHR